MITIKSANKMKKFRLLSFILALVLLAGIFAGCGKEEVAEGKDTVVWYVIGVESPDNPKVFKMANELLKEKTGLTIEFKYIDQAQYDLKFAAGEEFDLILCPDWLGYWENVKKGAFMSITEEEFKEHAPYIWEKGADYLETSKFDGKYYGIPGLVERRPDAILMARGDYMDKYGIESLDTIEDIDKFVMAAAKDKSHNIVPFNLPGGQHYIIHSLWAADWGWASPGTVSYGYHYYYDVNKDDFKLFLAVDQPQTKQFSENVKKWYDGGVFSKSVLSNATSSEEAFKNGKSLLAIIQGLANANTAYRDIQSIKGADKWDVRFYPAYSTMQRQYNSINTAVGISATSKNKINALKVLNAVYGTKEIYRLLVDGIEGEHFIVDDTGYTVTPDSKYSAPSLGITNQEFVYPYKPLFPYCDELEEEFKNKTLNDVLVNCPIMADDQYSAIAVKLGDITSEYTAPRMYGAVDNVDAALKREKDALKAADIDKYIKFVQSKVDGYVASHPEAVENFKESRKAVKEYNKKHPHKTNPKDYK